jgi:hypothetical protein
MNDWIVPQTAASLLTLKASPQHHFSTRFRKIKEKWISLALIVIGSSETLSSADNLCKEGIISPRFPEERSVPNFFCKLLAKPLLAQKR